MPHDMTEARKLNTTPGEDKEKEALYCTGWEAWKDEKDEEDDEKGKRMLPTTIDWAQSRPALKKKNPEWEVNLPALAKRNIPKCVTKIRPSGDDTFGLYIV